MQHQDPLCLLGCSSHGVGKGFMGKSRDVCQQQTTIAPGDWEGIGDLFVLSKGLESILSPSQGRAAPSVKLVMWAKASCQG